MEGHVGDWTYWRLTACVGGMDPNAADSPGYGPYKVSIFPVWEKGR